VIRLVLACNRRIGIDALSELMGAGLVPQLVVLPQSFEFTREVRGRFPDLPLMICSSSGDGTFIARIQESRPDIVLSVHFPYVFSDELLQLPILGTLNLHPALLPYNRGWHTPSWAIHDGTPYGATLHWVDEGLDTGPIVLQRELSVKASDTANSLYQRVLALELQLLRQAMPQLVTGKLASREQKDPGTSHNRRELDTLRDLKRNYGQVAADIIRDLRALTTNSWGEAAFLEDGGERLLVRVETRLENDS